MKDLAGKVAVITGAASGIGRALAQQCINEGMAVAITDVDANKLSAFADRLSRQGATVLAGVVDVADFSSMQNFAKKCRAELGQVSLLFNNAGILRIGQAWEQTNEDWEKIISINVMGVINGVNAFVPDMVASRSPGHIVNTGSVGSLVAAPGMSQYTACKMAVRGITECLYQEMQMEEVPIGVSLLCPGPVLTSIADDLMGVETANDDDPTQHMMADQPDFIAPQTVAEKVFASIKADEFWIITHPFSQDLKKRHDAIVQGINPSSDEVVFD